jgi:F-type H+-transporting ATPase subunit delta
LVSGTSIVSGIAGRYASALFDLAREQGTLDAAASDLASIDEMIGGSVDLARLVRSPVISRKDQGRAMVAVLESANISELVCRFVGLVAQNRRLFGLRDMIAAFRALLAVHRGETTARVTSAQPLTDEQVERIKSQLAGLVDQKISLSTDVDESLLGGLVVRIGSRMVDSSLRTKLQKMQTAMKEVG